MLELQHQNCCSMISIGLVSYSKGVPTCKRHSSMATSCWYSEGLRMHRSLLIRRLLGALLCLNY